MSRATFTGSDLPLQLRISPGRNTGAQASWAATSIDPHQLWLRNRRTKVVKAELGDFKNTILLQLQDKLLFPNVWFVGKKEKKVAPIVQTVAPRCVAFIQRTLQSPNAFRLLLGSFQSCSQQISRISCVEVRVWYNCNPSTSITQPMGGWESRDEKKGRSDKGQTSLPENRISTASNSGLCEADTPPQGETGNNTGSRRDQTSLVAWRILWFKVVLSCFGFFVFFLVFRQGQMKQSLGCEG